MKRRKITNAALFSAALMAAGTGATFVAAPAASALSVVGTYHYFDTFNNPIDQNAPLILFANHTINIFGNTVVGGCKGQWVTSPVNVGTGGVIALDITTNCFGEKWIFSGQVTPFGLNSEVNKGELIERSGGVSYHADWYAVR